MGAFPGALWALQVRVLKVSAPRPASGGWDLLGRHAGAWGCRIGAPSQPRLPAVGSGSSAAPGCRVSRE